MALLFIILVIGTINLAIGFSIAVYLEQRQAARPLVARTAVPEPAQQPETAEAAIPTSKTPSEEPQEIQTVNDQIEESWQEILNEEHIIASSFVEAACQVLRLKVGRYRQRLIQLDDQVRSCQVNPDTEFIDNLLNELRRVNNNWLAEQSDASRQLTDKQGNLGDFEETGLCLETVLLDQAAQIETTLSNIDIIDFKTDISAGCDRLIIEIRKLIDLAHKLRDRMQDSLVDIVKLENKFDTIDKRLQFDGQIGCHSRLGLEVLFFEARRDDPDRKRKMSCGMLDVDKFSRLMDAFGAVACDQMLISLGHLLSDLLNKEGDLNVVTRLEGQRFLLVFRDEGAQPAMHQIEQIRSTIEQTTFQWQGEAIQITVSCGVSEVSPEDDTDTICDRLSKAVQSGKRAGCNKTFLDEGDGPKAVEPIDLEIPGRVIRVEDRSDAPSLMPDVLEGSSL